MPRIYDEIILPCSKEMAFREIASVAFMKSVDPNYGIDTEVLFQNERLIRSVSRIKGIGDVEIERLAVPEANVIITQRRPPLGPFEYQLSIQTFKDNSTGTLLQWTNEFELNEENKEKEEVITSHIARNDHLILQKTKNYMANRS